MLKTILLGATSLTIVGMPCAQAQDRSRIWLGAGLGSAARSDGASGFAVMGEIVYQVKAHHFTIRAMGAAEPFGEGADEFGEIGLLYGRAAKRTWGHAAISGGLAITSVASCHASATSGCTTLGVPVVAEAALRFAPVVGVGIQGFANLNPKSVYGGLVLFLQLGWMP
jgi:hypothetical protein